MKILLSFLLLFLVASCKSERPQQSTPTLAPKVSTPAVVITPAQPTPTSPDAPQVPKSTDLQPSPSPTGAVETDKNLDLEPVVRRVCLENGKCKYLHIHKKYEGKVIPK